MESDSTRNIEKQGEVINSLEYLDDSAFWELLSNKEGVMKLLDTLKQRKAELERTYKNKGYTDADLKDLNTKGHLEHYKNVREKFNSLKRFLEGNALGAVTAGIEYDGGVIAEKYREWGVLDVHRKNVLADIDALPAKGEGGLSLLGNEEKEAAQQKVASSEPEVIVDKEEEAAKEKSVPEEETPSELYPQGDKLKAMQAEMDAAVNESGEVVVGDREEKPEEDTQGEERGFNKEEIITSSRERISEVKSELADALREKAGEMEVSAKDVSAAIGEDVRLEMAKIIDGIEWVLDEKEREMHPQDEEWITAQLQELEELKDQALARIKNNPEGSIKKAATRSEKPEPEKEDTKEVSKSSFAEVRGRWKEARDTSDALEKAYFEKLNEYYHGMETQKYFAKGGLGKVGYDTRKMFGIKPKLTPEITALYERSVIAKDEYKKQGAELVLKKYEGNGERGLTVVKRYEGMLAQKILLSSLDKSNNLQQDVVKEVHPNGTRIQRNLEILRKTMPIRVAAMVGVYGLVGGLTGGVGAGLIAGGSRLAGFAGGLVGGKIAGHTVSGILEHTMVAGARRQHEISRGSAKSDLFAKDFASLEKDIATSARKVEVAQRNKKIIATAAAAVAGLGSGAATAGYVGSGIGQSESIAPPTQGAAGDMNPTERDIETHDAGELDEPAVSPTQGATESLNLDGRNDETYIQSPTQGAAENPNPVDRSIENENGGEDPQEPINGGGEFFHPDKPMAPVLDGPAVESPVAPVESPEVEPVPPEESPAEPAEVIPEHSTYEVQKGNNLWNILEGEGPDAHPVGGKSEFVKDMSLAERRHALDTLVDYMEKNPDFTKSVGIEGGNPHIIQEGQHIDITTLDNKMQELLGESSAEPVVETDVINSESQSEAIVPETPVVPEAANTNEPAASDIPQPDRIVGSVPPYADPNLNQNVPPVESAPPSETNSPEVQSVVRTIIEGIEKPVGFIASMLGFGGENIVGAYEALKDLTLGEIVELEQDVTLREQFLQEHNIPAQGFEKHFANIQDMDNSVGAQPDETYDELMNRFAMASVANDNGVSSARAA